MFQLYVVKTLSGISLKIALVELLLYLIIIEVVFSFMSLIGDGENSLLVIKTITYVFSYVYLQNAFKNLIIAYPRNKGFRIIYHVIRFEFKRLRLRTYKELLIESKTN